MITKLRLASANLQYGRANDTATLAEVASGQPYSSQVARQLYSQVRPAAAWLNADVVCYRKWICTKTAQVGWIWRVC